MSEIIAYCGSCKMDLAATVVAKVGSKIVKVMCNTCKKERAYKAPKGVSEPGVSPPASSPKRKAKASEDSPKSVSFEVEWNRLMGEADLKNKIKYSVKAVIGLGQVIEHPTFGDGIVMRQIHPDKVEVLFKDDLKLLIHSRK